MKRIIIILSMLLGGTTVFCQTVRNGIAELGMDAQHIPYKTNHASSPSRNGEIWRPLNSYLYYLYPYPNAPYYESKYRYDTNGLLQQVNIHFPGDTLDSFIDAYNRTFTKEGFDFEDTLTDYTVKNGKQIPTSRVYFDYHYYDRYPQDSFYYVSYQEKWNNTTQEWEKFRKFYQGHFDTTLFVIREYIFFNYTDGEWVKYFGFRALREYNEEGMLTCQILQDCNSETGTGEYEMSIKEEYFYDENNIHVETWNYYFNADDWKLRYKDTDIQYTEWYPNCQAIIEFTGSVGGPEFPLISGRRAKKKSFTTWAPNYNNGGEWEKYMRHKHDWDINGTKSHIDSIYRFYNDVWRLYFIEGRLYNERGDFIQNSTDSFLPNGELYTGEKSCFLTSYHPLYDEPESEYRYFLQYNNATQTWDSTFFGLEEYFNWHDVTQPVSITEPAPSASVALSIFPNPVSDILTISAPSAIQQLSIYDITSRLVASPSPAGERVVFDTGALPQGVYLVRALLKDGGVRTGKLIKN